MFVSPSLTPFSRSVVLASLQSAHRRHVRSLSLPDASVAVWDQRPLAALIVSTWDVSVPCVAHLLGLATAPAPVARTTKGANAAREALAEADAARKRLADWADRVAAMRWGQAQLLQVMEEIEPYLSAALYAEQRLAAACVGGYATILAAAARSGAGALDVIAGLATPEGQMIDDLVAGASADEWLKRYGYRGDDELEISAPRLAEAPPYLPASRDTAAWRPSAAQQRREQATAQIIAGAGFLQRGKLRSTIEQTQAAFVAHAQMRDALARALASIRRWTLAAAAEGVKDGRLNDASEVFLLELEEIKQMLTGEWHRREQVQPLIAERKNQPAPQTQSATDVRPLGIAGAAITAPLRRLAQPQDVTDLPGGAVAYVERPSAAWAGLYLRAGGVIGGAGDVLSFAARAARSGGVPTVVGGATLMVSLEEEFALDPARFGPCKAE